MAERVDEPDKTAFKLFRLSSPTANTSNPSSTTTKSWNCQSIRDAEEREGAESPGADAGAYEYLGRDILSTIKVETVGSEGMKIDRMFFEKFEDTVRKDEVIAGAVEAGQWDRVIDYVNQEVFDRPEEYYTLEKLRRAAAVDRRITLQRDSGEGIRADPEI